MEFPVEMYRIRKEEMKFKVPCESCLEKGMVDGTCPKCGGKGIHSKTIKVWKVAPKTVTVEKIDRSSSDSFYKGVQTSYKNGLRYWTGQNDFYNDAEMYMHFTKNEAQKECNKRNEGIKGLLEVDRKNKLAASSDNNKIHDDNQGETFDSLVKRLAFTDSSFAQYLRDTGYRMWI